MFDRQKKLRVQRPGSNTMATFSEAFTRMRENFDQAHESRLNLIRDTRADVAEKAKQTGSQLAQQAHQRQADFAATMQGLRGKLHEQACHTRQQLAQQARQRQADFAATMQGLRGRLHEQARQTRQQLADLAADLGHAGKVFNGR